jgi:hypothetical protein
MLKKAVRQGRSERRGGRMLQYVEPLSDARTMLAVFFNILLLARSLFLFGEDVQFAQP